MRPVVCHDRTDLDAVWAVDSGASKEARVIDGCTLAQPGEYDRTVDVRRRCGLFAKLLRPFVNDLANLIVLRQEKQRKSIYITPFRTKVHTKRSGMDHTVSPANNTMPALKAVVRPTCKNKFFSASKNVFTYVTTALDAAGVENSTAVGRYDN